MIQYHSQNFFQTAAELLDQESESLARLIGRDIRECWIAIDSDGSWFNDEPAVLLFDDLQLEIAVYQIGLLSITWNSIDLGQSPNWLGCWEQIDGLRWQRATQPEFQHATGKSIHSLLIASDDTGVAGIQVAHDGGFLSIFNALDELGVADGELEASQYVLHPLKD